MAARGCCISAGLEEGWPPPCHLVSGLATERCHLQGGTVLCLSVSCPPEIIIQVLMDISQKARSRNIGILHPSFSLGRNLQESLQRHLPDNVHMLISGKTCISLTRVSDGENVLVSEFQSKEEVVDVSSLLIWALPNKRYFVLEVTQRGLP